MCIFCVENMKAPIICHLDDLKKHIFTEKISSTSRITLIYCETVWLLLEMVVLLILHIFSQFQAPLRWTFNALPLRRKAYLSLGTPLLGKIGTESCKNTASFIDLWCFGKVGNQKWKDSSKKIALALTNYASKNICTNMQIFSSSPQLSILLRTRKDLLNEHYLETICRELE